MKGETLLNPVGEIEALDLGLADRLRTLEGKTIGLIDNGAPFGDIFFSRVEKRLRERYGVGAVVRKLKPRLCMPLVRSDDSDKRWHGIITGVGMGGGAITGSIIDAVESEKKGIPSATLCTHGTDGLARAEACGLGVPSLPIVVLPVAFRQSPEGAETAADEAIDGIVRALTAARERLAEEYRGKGLSEKVSGEPTRPEFLDTLDFVVVPPSVEGATEAFYNRGWTDGLPIYAPTKKAVESMMAYGDRAPSEMVAKVGPRWGMATIEKIAVNATMAGCLPEYLPVIVAAVQALVEPEFNLSAVQGMTSPVAPLVIINGPAVDELKLNYRSNVFGQGWRSNATIGRAIRLILMNIGGGIPGATDESILGQPGKYSFCIAENQKESPWESLHVERGFKAENSTVTVIGIQAIHNFVGWAFSASGLLDIAAKTMGSFGTNNSWYSGTPLLVLNPGHANAMSRAGYTKQAVKRFIFENARVPLSLLPEETVPFFRLARPQLNWEEEDMRIPIVDKPEDVMVMVAGAVGLHSAFLPTFGDPTLPVTKPIAFADGTPVRCIADLRRTWPP